jgi:hypothetical protein
MKNQKRLRVLSSTNTSFIHPPLLSVFAAF